MTKLLISMGIKGEDDMVPAQLFAPFPIEMFKQGGVLILRPQNILEPEEVAKLKAFLAEQADKWPVELPTSLLLVPAWCDVLEVVEIQEGSNGHDLASG